MITETLTTTCSLGLFSHNVAFTDLSSFVTWPASRRKQSTLASATSVEHNIDNQLQGELTLLSVLAAVVQLNSAFYNKRTTNTCGSQAIIWAVPVYVSAHVIYIFGSGLKLRQSQNTHVDRDHFSLKTLFKWQSSRMDAATITQNCFTSPIFGPKGVFQCPWLLSPTTTWTAGRTSQSSEGGGYVFHQDL